MLKNRLYLIILLLPAYLLMSYSSGAPVGKTGSPGDGGNTCTACHTGSTSYMPSISISGLPLQGYVPGQTYNVHLEVNSVSNPTTGFEINVENASNQRMGTFANTDGTTQAIFNNQYITHTGAGTAQHAWNFQWTAPSTSQGNLRMYYAVNIANGNGSSTGDYIEHGNFPINENTAAINTIKNDEISVFPNPTADSLYINNVTGKIKQIHISDINGKLYDVKMQNSAIDISFLPKGVYSLRIEQEKVTRIKRFIKK